MVNIHHLELFFHVARHQGISEAVRRIPYGIQQPAVSAQILSLEEYLGVKLFNRRPFNLTPAGERLYDFIKPFFEGIEAVADELRGDIHQLRFGGSAIMLRDHVPDIMQSVRERFPGLKLTLREGHSPQLMGWLKNQELDVATTLIEGKPPVGFNWLPMLDLPLILLVPKGNRITSARELWERDKIEEALISLPPFETIPRHFQQGLTRLGVDWLPRIEVSSLTLIETYVANGYGIGLYIAIPKHKFATGIKALPLDDFPPVTFGALWQGKLSHVGECVVQQLQQRVTAFTQ